MSMTHPFQQHLSNRTSLEAFRKKLESHIPLSVHEHDLVSANGLVNALAFWVQQGMTIERLARAVGTEYLPVWGIHDDQHPNIWAVWMDESLKHFHLWSHHTRFKDHIKIGRIA